MHLYMRCGNVFELNIIPHRHFGGILRLLFKPRVKTRKYEISCTNVIRRPCISSLQVYDVTLLQHSTSNMAAATVAHRLTPLWGD